MKCDNCSANLRESDRFCFKCGSEVLREQSVYVGESTTRARYRITFAPVEDIFNSKDAVEEAARNSFWGEDREFPSWTIEEVENLVPAGKYPFVCVCGECVSPTMDGACAFCGKTEWLRRMK